MAFVPSDFADDTAFERFMLERLGSYRVKPPEPGAIHDIRDGVRQNITIHVGSAILGTKAADDLRGALQPLGFGAAYKVLDVLIEHVLRASGAQGRLRFDVKVATVTSGQRQVSLPVPLDSRRDLWDRLCLLYGALKEARHATTHRRVNATASGDLEIYDDRATQIDTITRAEVEGFAAAVHAAAELVIDATSDPRRTDLAAEYLNALTSRHGLAVIPGVGTGLPHRLLRVSLRETQSGELELDLDHVRRTVAGQTPSLWDLELYSDSRLFVGRWEGVANIQADSLTFDPASLPGWLTEEIP